MKTIIFGILILIGNQLYGQSPFQSKIRTLFTKVDESELYNKELWELTKSTNLDNPNVYAYKCLYYIMNAKYVFLLNKKFQNFTMGKEKLETAIEKYPLNADLRLVRYSVQMNAPKFLKYYSNTAEDKKMLLNFRDSNKTDRDLVALIDGVLARFP